MKRLVVFLLFLAGICAHAQVSRGTITGRVTDPSGAVVPGAQINAVQVSTGSTYTTQSDKEGLYTVPFLAPGTYQVNATCSGFKSFTRGGVIINANENVGVAITLEIGQQTETVTVSADSPLIETVSASTGQTLNNEDVQHMPVDGNTPLILSQLSQGVVFTNNPQFFHPFDNSGPSGMAIGGGASKQNELLMDGAPDAQQDATISYNPPLDAVDQVKVETFQADAAYGHTAGGTVNQVTKSGTNSFHGSLYEYGQWSALDDTPWFTKAANATKSVTRYNQYGGSFGGPVLVPKVYNGHNRAFVFFAYEGIKDNSPSPSITTVPTDAEKQGDFSALLALGSSYAIYDPASGAVSGSKVQRTAFANNKLTSLNSVGKNLVSYFAEPNLSGLANGENNYYYPGNSTDSFDSEFGRIDINLTSRNKLFYDFRHNNRYHVSGNVFNNIATGSILVSPIWGSTLDDVHVFTPQTVWDNRLNWARSITSRPLQASAPLSQLGFPSALQSAVTRQGFPVTSGTNYVNFGYSKGQYLAFDSLQLFSMLSHFVGKHSLEAGVDLRISKQYSNSYGNSDGSYGFGLNSGQGWTNGPYNNSAAAPIGQELAALLLGLPTTGSIDVNVNETTSAVYGAAFIQDNYHVTQNLTLNIGLRYEHDFPTVESNNKAVNGFNTTTISPINTAAQTAYAANPVAGITLAPIYGGLTFATSNNRNMYQTQNMNFSPRVGFAWTPLVHTSMRGGLGLFNDSVGQQSAIAPGFNQTTQMQPTLNSYLTANATLSNPFPGGLTAPPGASGGLSTYMGQSISYYPHKILNDYAVRWDLDVQRDLPGNTLIEVGYLGAHLSHLGVSTNLDYVPASYLNVGQVRNSTVVNFLSASVTNPFAGLLPGTSLNGATVQQQQLLLPYPQYSGITLTNNPIGSSFYDALQVRLEKRMSHGVRYMMNYQWSKKLDKLDFLNPQDTHLEKRISADDRPQRLMTSATWQLPFGKDRHFNPAIPVANYVISGWDLTGIYTYQPYGAPLAWGDVIYLGSSLNNLKVNPHNVNAAFDVTQFDTKSADQPVTGDHIRTLPTQVAHARADGINSMDLSISKANRITEGLHAQLRADFFNALNHPNFSAPSLSPTSSGFAKITSQANLPRQVQVELKLTF